jgi:hypothetical protein
MNEKLAMDSVLACTNTIITLLNYSIKQSNNKNFRDTLIEHRNKLENLQWQVYLINKEKGYYIPAAPAGEADIQQVKQAISQ